MWTIKFADDCTRQVRNMHWRAASIICAVVIQFARTGDGRVEWITRHRIRLRSREAIAEICINERQRILGVLYIRTVS